jgi:hypothetical protein
MKRSVEAVYEAADDQQMLVSIVLSRIEENQTRTEKVAELTEDGVNEAQRMVGAAHSLNEITKKFVV